MKLQTPKGFRDFLPSEAIKRKFVLEKIVKVFEKFGFDPIETPTMEYAQTLKGKYGEEEKLIYEFKTRGGDEVALKYDLTVPLARVIAQYGPTGAQTLPIPFKRYQVQPVFRGENPQKGRYREFLQCDADIIEISSPLADTELLALCYEVYRELGLDIIIKVNDRSLILDIEPKYLAAIDKVNKIGKEGVLAELEEKGLSKDAAVKLFEKIESLKPSENLVEIFSLYEKMSYPKDSLLFDPSLIRGLDYYTGLILEVVLKDDPNSSSLCGGGRYDRLIGKFTGNDLPAVGFAIGFDRTVEAIQKAGLIKDLPTKTEVLVTIFSEDLIDKSLEVTSRLRSKNIPCELWLDPETKLEKQLKYADLKGIPFAIILGPDEARLGKVTLKDLKSQSQQTLTLDEVIQKLSS